MTTKENIKAIVQAIKAEDRRLRKKYPILSHQNTIGLLITFAALACMIGLATLYYFDVIPAWLCIFLSAIVASISHEVEHDLIHKQYFSKQPIVHNFMMLLVWIMRPNTINPWYRRELHLNHHAVSGTDQDLEERLVGNGIKNPFMRFLVIVDGLIGLIVNSRRYSREIKGFSFFKVLNAAFPIATAYFIVLYTFLLFHLTSLFLPMSDISPSWLLATMDVFSFLMVVLIAPNIIRSVSLNFVTSSMHYYGNVTNLYEQTHVITSRWFAPFHLFCFNFGKTHTIHHYAPNQPFYLRQLVSHKIHKVMKEHGVRFNDFASLRNANLYTP
ncbi:MAG: fatty acid desaturase [Pseudomonadota bacterium]